jgi:hypothetical protein
MYVNAKMIPVETILGIGEGIKEDDGGGEFNFDIFDTLQKPSKMPHCIPTQQNNKEEIN